MAEPSPSRGGRPQLTADQRRSHTISVRFTGAEIAALRHRAARAGRSVAAVIRDDLARASTAGAQAEPDHFGAALLRRDIARIGSALNAAVKTLQSARGRRGGRALEAIEAVRRAAVAVAERIARAA